MKWFNIYVTGIIAWLIPFVLIEMLFPAIPEAYGFIIQLLACLFALTYISSRMSSGYLRRRVKMTFSYGISIGIMWFANAVVMKLVYSYVLLENDPLEILIYEAPVYLIYLLIPMFHGLCEDKRGRRYQ